MLIQILTLIELVGRTGSGKSSLTMSLFRIAELSHGKILIDDIDISKISLDCLRSSIEIVPQNPVLFSGKIRDYLDPLKEFTDEEIWIALDKCHMRLIILQLAANSLDTTNTTNTTNTSLNGIQGLDAIIHDNGCNLSVGERQMLVLSRAVLKGAKILIMDEATASIDYETDAKIQQVLQNEFQSSTVLTIAHRIETILHCDKILVMSLGQVVQYESPKTLIQQQHGIFYDLVKEGISEDVIKTFL